MPAPRKTGKARSSGRPPRSTGSVSPVDHHTSSDLQSCAGSKRRKRGEPPSLRRRSLQLLFCPRAGSGARPGATFPSPGSPGFFGAPSPGGRLFRLPVFTRVLCPATVARTTRLSDHLPIIQSPAKEGLKRKGRANVGADGVASAFWGCGGGRGQKFDEARIHHV